MGIQLANNRDTEVTLTYTENGGERRSMTWQAVDVQLEEKIAFNKYSGFSTGVIEFNIRGSSAPAKINKLAPGNLVKNPTISVRPGDTPPEAWAAAPISEFWFACGVHAAEMNLDRGNAIDSVLRLWRPALADEINETEIDPRRENLGATCHWLEMHW